MNVPQHPRVLYAEDNEDAQVILTTMLGFSGIEVIGLSTVAEAWRRSQAEHFDLYLLDSRFSDGSGLDLCRSLRQKKPHIPVLFYSGEAYPIDVQNGLEAGAAGYFVKPNFDKLVEKILQTVKNLNKVCC